MAFFQFKRTQKLNTSLEEVWGFISNPENLKKITPDYMGFDITSSDLPGSMYEGMIISYKVSPLLGIKTTWVTEITKVKELSYFIDEQRVGPYKLWHHQHKIKPVEDGVLMEDIVSYAPPLGFLGKIANQLFIRKKLNEIFEYRRTAMQSEFGEIH